MNKAQRKRWAAGYVASLIRNGTDEGLQDAYPEEFEKLYEALLDFAEGLQAKAKEYGEVMPNGIPPLKPRQETTNDYQG